jgi:hypothetical protein
MSIGKNDLDQNQLAIFGCKSEYCALIQNEQSLNSRITIMIESESHSLYTW